jgi:D-3-phosphoglycerate dehydrogenase
MDVLVNDPIAEEGLEILREQHDVDTGKRGPDALLEDVAGFEAMVVRSGTTVTEDVLEAADDLRGIVRAGVGVDNIDLDAAEERGVVVANVPGAASNAVAELAIGHMLGLARQLQRGDATLRDGDWAKSRIEGIELRGRTLGLVGLGRIGSLVAGKATALGMDVVAHDPFVGEEQVRELDVTLADGIGDLAEQVDVLSLHVPVTEETRGLVDAALLAKLGEDGLLVNCARGGIVDEDALYDALKAGRIRAAAMDVFEEEPPGDHPLLELENFRGTPHLGASTVESQRRVGVGAAEEVLRILGGEEPENRVV